MVRIHFRRQLSSAALVALLTATGCDTALPPLAEDHSRRGEPGKSALLSEVPGDSAGASLNDPEAANAEGIVRVSAIGAAQSGVRLADGGGHHVGLTPEELLAEIARLKSVPAEIVARQPDPDRPGEFREVPLTPGQQREEFIRRQRTILDLAVQVVAATYRKPAAEDQFNAAIVALAESRLELACQGVEEQGQKLQEDAETLFKQDATSFAAVETSFKLVQLAQRLAGLHDDAPIWSIGYARQARLFAERFPHEFARASVALAGAARQCDRQGQGAEARHCWEALQTRFPESPYSTEAAACVRRLSLVGQPLVEFGGPTLAGGVVDLRQLAGRPLLIVFWSSTSTEFAADLPELQRAVQRTGKDVAVIGVNLDEQQSAVEDFLAAHQLDWPQIWYVDPHLRGRRNLVAAYYGVEEIPSYWIVGSDGTVRSVHARVSEIERLLAQ